MKRLSLITISILLISLFNITHVEGYFRVNDDTKTTQYVEGVRHQEIIGTINFNGVESLQKINYLGANPTTKSNLNIATSDNYLAHDWGKGTLTQLADNIHSRYDNYTVVGGVNGDFFGSNGIPIEAYVRNFEVISAGLGNARTVIGFKDSGEVAYGRPCFNGYELIVYNSLGQKKTTLDVDWINKSPNNSDEISVYFDNHTGMVTSDYEKIVLTATETHRDDWGHTYFGKGTFNTETTEVLDLVSPQTLVIVGDKINEFDLFTGGDYAVVQQSMACGFEDVRFALGGWEILVTDGVATEEFTEGAGPQYRHPRTAVGIKEDGTVFFVTVDGRDYVNGYLGVTAKELSELMLYFGAYNAFNVDGGGSTAMILLDDEGAYQYMNTPSDGSPRPTTNGMFFVLGENPESIVDAVYPDFRTVLDTPSKIFISREGLLDFEDVLNAEKYTLDINGTEVTLNSSDFALDLPAGVYEIKIKAVGDQVDYKDSEYTVIFEYRVFSDNVQRIIDYLTDIAQSKEE